MRITIYRINIILLLGLICFIPELFGQVSDYSVTGEVTDMYGNPVSDVSISIESYGHEPVFTNEEGTFSLMVPSGNVWLLVVPDNNFHSKRLFLNSKKEITIYLTAIDIGSLDERINVGQKVKERKNIISSYKSYNPQNDYVYPYETIDQYFQGMVSDMQVINLSGMPGSATTSYIRGMKSLNTNNQPLYVIDGVPLETFGIFKSVISGYTYNPLTSIDPFDVSTITILKDNVATARYGVRGSNGVILIETLKPTELSTTIDFSFKSGVRMMQNRFIPQMNNNQHRTYANEVLLTSDILEDDFPALYPALFSNAYSNNFHRYKHNTNWQELIFEPGLMNEAQLRIKGGDAIARYGLSVSYMNKDGIVSSTNYNRLNIRLVGTFNIFRWLRMYVSTHLNTNTSSLAESALSKQSSPILTSLSKTPMMMPYAFNRDGEQLLTLDDVGSLGVSNPSAIIANYYGVSTNHHSLNSIRLEGDLSKNLVFKSLFGINLNTLSEKVFLPNYGMAYYYDGTAYNVSKNNKNFLYSIYNDNSVSYNPVLGDIHNVDMDLGFSVNTNKLQQDIGIAKNSHENDEYQSLQSGVFYLNEIDGQLSQWNRLSFYYNFNYSLKNKYLFNFLVSAENSTRMGKKTDLPKIGNVPFGIFYSIGTGWRLSSEKFLKDISWIEELKLRLSYSVSGNDDIGNTTAFNYLSIGHYRETTGVYQDNYTDGTIRNENYSQINMGFDMALWGSRLNLQANYYTITSGDMLIYEPRRFYTGYSVLPVNSGSVTNKGFEFSMDFRVIGSGRFNWDMGLNLTPWHKSTVNEIYNDKLVNSFPGGEFVTKTGKSLLEFYGLQFDGVYADTEEAETAGLRNEKGIPFVAGDARYKDISGSDGVSDGIINEHDNVPLGSPIPKSFGGLANTFSYKRWSLSANLYFVSGNKVFNYLRYENEKMSDLSNQSTSVLKRWFYEGQKTDIPRALWDDPIGNSAFSSRWIEDGSYLRLRNVTLSYSMPNKILIFRNLSAYVTMTNIYTLTNYLGYDPEFSFSFSSKRQGIDYGLIPVTASVIAGIKLGL